MENHQTGTTQPTATDRIKELRVELQEIYKRAQEGREFLTDERRADDIAYELRELTER